MADKVKKLKASDPCPNCGGALVAHPAPEKRAIVKTMLESSNPNSAAYADNFADKHLEKEAEHGVVHVCSGCRYVTRIKAAA